MFRFSYFVERFIIMCHFVILTPLYRKLNITQIGTKTLIKNYVM